jgi:hypothetical protein
MQVKNILKFHFTQSEWHSSRKQTKGDIGEDVGKTELLYTVGGNAN